MSKEYLALLFLFGSLVWSCSNNGAPYTSEVNSPRDATAISSATPPSREIFDRFGSPVLDWDGVIVLSDSYSKQNDIIQFYNGDGSLWYEFTFYYDDSDGKFEYENDSFKPYSFHPDYFTLALRLNGEDPKYYEVIVNEETLLTKYVKKSDSWYRVVTWQNHILDTFAIDFDKSKNPIRETPDEKIKEIATLEVARFAATSFDGDWLKVEWDVSGSEQGDDLRKDSGWIRWRDGNRLLIDWSYFA